MHMRLLLSMLLVSALGGCGSSAALTDAKGGSMEGRDDASEGRDGASDADDAAPRPACSAMSISDGSSSGARQEVASIHVTASTNSGEIDVVVFSDRSAERTIGPHRYDASTGLDPPPKSYPPGSPEVIMFLCDLAAVGDVSAIPADPGKPSPTLPGCAKSASFGTITTITTEGKTSGDLQCLDHPTSAATALAHDAAVLAG
jgi:hypothetical protein